MDLTKGLAIEGILEKYYEGTCPNESHVHLEGAARVPILKRLLAKDGIRLWILAI